MIVGQVLVQIDGTPGLIYAGSGYSIGMIGSGVDLAIRITLDQKWTGVAIGTNPDNVVIMAQAIYGGTNAIFYCSTWTHTATSSYFTLRGIGWSSGSVRVNFQAYVAT